MNLFRSTCILLLATGLQVSALAQDDEYDDIDAFFQDDFESTPRVTVYDPLEGVNRAIFKFNDGFYRKVARPVSNGYRKVMPDAAERGLTNAFYNLKFPSRFVSNVLQGRLVQAGKETGKFVVNSTVGLAGFLNPAKEFENLSTSDEDIGQALGSWGVPHGFYLVIPILGPTSLRDFAANFADDAVEPLPNPWSVIDEDSLRYAVAGLEILNNIHSLLDLYDSMRRSAIDPYSSVRDAYAQRRAGQVKE